MNQCTRRIQKIATHLIKRRNCSTSTKSHSFHIHEITVGDTPEGWINAGFTVDDGWKREKLVFFDNCTIRLTSEGNGLSQITFGTNKDNSKDTTLSLPGLTKSTILKTPPAAIGMPTNHPNSATKIGEIVLYTQHLDSFVKEMRKVGINTHKNKTPKITAEHYSCAKYFFGQESSNQIRLLVFGPNDPNHDSSKNSDQMWMLGKGTGTEITGYLPLVNSMSALTNHCRHVSTPKTAIQKNRTIATLKKDMINGLTGTFAFLSDEKEVKGDPLF